MTNKTNVTGTEDNKKTKLYTDMDMDKLKEEIVYRIKDKFLVPFYVFVAMYYVLYQPFWNYPPTTLTAALMKVLPVWSLVVYVKLTTCSNLNGLTDIKNFFEVDDYPKFVMVGLLLSSLGDTFLICRKTLFVPGMIAFAIAHAFYMHAMGPGNLKSRYTEIFILTALGMYLFLHDGIETLFMQIMVIIYTALILSVGWKAVTRYESERSIPNLTSAIGILLFIFSDFIIGVDKWKFDLPFSQFTVMTSYYASQFFLALSTSHISSKK